MTTSFYVNVFELMKSLLPRPTPKVIVDLLDVDRVESLSELPIVSISARDCDYNEEC